MIEKVSLKTKVRNTVIPLARSGSWLRRSKEEQKWVIFRSSNTVS